MRLLCSMRARVTWWVLAFLVFTLGVYWLPGITNSWQFARNAYTAGDWWLPLTAQWVHWSGLHAAINAMGFAVLLLAFQHLVTGRIQAIALLGGYAGVAIVIALDTNCARYAGASGALHGLLAGSALGLLLPPQQPLARQHTHAQWLGGLMLLGLVIKLVVQHGGANAAIPGWLGFATYYPAHEAGAVGGLIAVLLTRVLQWRRRSANPGTSA